MANQFRDYCLTINNPTQTDEEFLEYCKQLPHLKYLVFQREVGAEKNTEHFQIYLEFTLGKRFDKTYKPNSLPRLKPLNAGYTALLTLIGKWSKVTVPCHSVRLWRT